MKQLIGFCSFFGAVLHGSVTDIRVPFRFESSFEQQVAFASPIQLRIAGSERIIDSNAGFVFRPHSHIAHTRGIVGSVRVDRLNFTDVDNGQSAMFPVNLEISAPGLISMNPDVYIPIHPGSVFLESVGNILIVPSSTNGGHIILNPSNPGEHVYGGDIVYTMVHDRNNTWSFDAYFGFMNEPEAASDAVSVVLNPSLKESYIPPLLLSAIDSRIRELGTNIQSEVHFENPTDIDSLPVILISIPTSAGNRFTLAMPPRDYLKPLDLSNDYLLTLRAAPNNTTHILGRNFIDKIAYHLDPSNRRIGFGDPLMEL